MNLVLKGKNFVISDRVRNYVEKKLGKLDRYLPEIDEARVEITQEKTKSAQDRNVVQVTLRTNGAILRAETRSGAIYGSIDTVIDKIHRQIARYKEKRVDRWHGTMTKQQRLSQEVQAQPDETSELSVEAATAASEPEGQLVRTKHFLMTPMTEDEAIEQMELLGHNFFVFYNANLGRVNVLYRRADNNYGLLDPELA
jgi:putative sigma-54 modulation protein